MKPFAFAFVCISLAAPLVAQGRGGQPPGQQPGASSAAPRHETAGPAEEKISQTSHSIRIDGHEIKYTATAGTLPIRLDNGEIAARMFFVAYTKDGEEARLRPLSFLYNGGPGAATIWLHMGSFAPKHVRMADEGFQPAPPYTIEDNQHSLMDVSDLAATVAEAGRILAPGGRLCACVTHPMAEAGAFQGKAPDAPFVVSGDYLADRRTDDSFERGGLLITFLFLREIAKIAGGVL